MKQVVRVESVGKCYPTYAGNLARFGRWFGLPARAVREFWAVRDVSFALERGEALALIGQNGAGKSTLLKLITGVVRPTTGAVMIGGRVGAILELGLGFNPDLNGRQNVHLAGGLMGLSTAELDALMPQIEEFAEIAEFFDQPLRVYSSGMQMRLAFAVATAVRPDVLVVDEVLSVGDSYFQHKSFDRIRQFRQQGTSLLLVSHGMGDVRALCDRVMLLDRGAVLKEGLPDEVTDYYNALIAARENSKLSIEQRRQKDGWLVTRSGSGACLVADAQLLDTATGAPVTLCTVGQRLTLLLEIEIRSAVPALVVGFMIRDKAGHIVWGTNTWHTGQRLQHVAAGQRWRFALDLICSLGPGSYAFTFALCSTDTHVVDNYEWTDNALVFDVANLDRSFFVGTSHIEAGIRVERIEP